MITKYRYKRNNEQKKWQSIPLLATVLILFSLSFGIFAGAGNASSQLELTLANSSGIYNFTSDMSSLMVLSDDQNGYATVHKENSQLIVTLCNFTVLNATSMIINASKLPLIIYLEDATSNIMNTVKGTGVIDASENLTITGSGKLHLHINTTAESSNALHGKKNITITGKSTVTAITDNDRSNAIYAGKGLTISDKATVTAITYGKWANALYNTAVLPITLTDATVVAETSAFWSNAIYSYAGKIRISNSSVLSQTFGPSSNALYSVRQNIEISHSTVTASTQGKNSRSIYVRKADVSITDSSTLALNTKNIFSDCINCENNITIMNSKVSVTTLDNLSIGIYSFKGKIDIGGTSDVSVKRNLTTEGYGIHTDNRIEFTGPQLNLSVEGNPAFRIFPTTESLESTHTLTGTLKKGQKITGWNQFHVANLSDIISISITPKTSPIIPPSKKQTGSTIILPQDKTEPTITPIPTPTSTSTFSLSTPHPTSIPSAPTPINTSSPSPLCGLIVGLGIAGFIRHLRNR